MPKTVEIVARNGVPSLCYDGQPVSPASVYLYRIDADEIRRFAATGIHLYTFGMRLSDDETFATFDRMVDDLAEADPQRSWPPELEDLLARMLAKAPEKRPARCSDILTELDAGLDQTFARIA